MFMFLRVHMQRRTNRGAYCGTFLGGFACLIELHLMATAQDRRAHRLNSWSLHRRSHGGHQSVGCLQELYIE